MRGKWGYGEMVREERGCGGRVKCEMGGEGEREGAWRCGEGGERNRRLGRESVHVNCLPSCLSST